MRASACRNDEAADDGHPALLTYAKGWRSIQPRQQARLEDEVEAPGLGIRNRFNVPDCRSVFIGTRHSPSTKSARRRL